MISVTGATSFMMLREWAKANKKTEKQIRQEIKDRVDAELARMERSRYD